MIALLQLLNVDINNLFDQRENFYRVIYASN